MSGGDDIVARRNYDRTDTHFNLELSMLMFANEYITKQGDVAEHCLEFEGCTSFVTQHQLDEMALTMQPESLQKFRIADPDIKALCSTREYHLKMISVKNVRKDLGISRSSSRITGLSSNSSSLIGFLALNDLAAGQKVKSLNILEVDCFHNNSRAYTRIPLSSALPSKKFG